MSQRNRYPALVGSTAIVLALAGCLGTSVVQTDRSLKQMETKTVVVPQTQYSNLTLTIEDQDQAPTQGYKVNYVRVLDWDKVKATLDKVNADGTTDTTFTPVSAEKAVQVSGTRRTATITLPSLTAGGGYRIKVDLIKAIYGDSTNIIATGTNAGNGSGFTINGGANTITVTLGLTNKGEAVINVPPPFIATSLTTSADTNSPFKIVRYAGTDIPDASTTRNVSNVGTATSPTELNLSEPAGIDMNASGEFVVADASHHAVLRLTSTGATVVAGTPGSVGYAGDGGAATSAKLYYPAGIAYVPAVNSLYIADRYNHRVRVVDSSNNISTFAGGGTTAPSTTAIPATSASLSQPMGLVIDDIGNVYFTEYGGNRICRVDPDGNLVTIATNVTNPGPLAIDRVNKVLWYSSGGVIYRITGISSATPAGPYSVYSFGSYYPVHGLTYDHNGMLYATRTYNANSASYDRRYYNHVYRLAVNSAGAYLRIEQIAGYNFDTINSAFGSVPTTEQANALNVAMAGAGFAGMFIDMSKADTTTDQSGFLYLSQWHYNNGWGQILKLSNTTL